MATLNELDRALDAYERVLQVRIIIVKKEEFKMGCALEFNN